MLGNILHNIGYVVILIVVIYILSHQNKFMSGKDD